MDVLKKCVTVTGLPEERLKHDDSISMSGLQEGTYGQERKCKEEGPMLLRGGDCCSGRDGRRHHTIFVRGVRAANQDWV
jgi:hypothetical protein